MLTDFPLMGVGRAAGIPALLLCALPGQVARADWELVPEISIGAESDDNPRLIDDDDAAALGRDDAATRLLAEASFGLQNVGERGRIALTPAVSADAYVEEADDELQSTDVFLRSNGELQWRRALAGFNANLSSERILGSEFLAAEPGDLDLTEPEPADTVLVGLNERRRRVFVAPYTEITSGGRHTTRIDARLQDVSYDAEIASARSDFSEAALAAEYIRRLDARNALSGGISAARFEAERNGNETDTVGVELGFSRELSAIWSLGLAVGALRSDARFIDPAGLVVTRAEDHATFGLGVRKRTETARLNIDLQRNVSPDSFGFLALRNQLRVAVQRQMSPNLDGTFAVRAIETSSAADAASRDRLFGRLELGVDWAFTETWSLFAEYMYSTRRDDLITTDPVEAASNAISLGFTYRGLARR